VKLDLYRRHRAEYVAPRKPVLVRVGRAKYLAIDGAGGPKTPAFQAAIGALYAMAFTIKMTKKFAGRDYTVAKLEGLWWGGRRGKLLIDSPPSSWRWRLMIRVPPFISERDRRAALAVLADRGKGPVIRRVKLESVTEGPCVQILHVGPYDREHASIAAMEAFARAGGLRLRGRHHEIYLSDPRRVAPARLKTILRHPVKNGPGSRR
jgi:hypothetical protein